MFARVSTIQVTPQRVGEAIKMFQEKAIPGVKAMKCFKAANFLVDRKTGNSKAIFFFDTEVNLKASSEPASQLRTQITQALGAKVLSVEEYEVAAQSW